MTLRDTVLVLAAAGTIAMSACASVPKVPVVIGGYAQVSGISLKSNFMTDFYYVRNELPSVLNRQEVYEEINPAPFPGALTVLQDASLEIITYQASFTRKDNVDLLTISALPSHSKACKVDYVMNNNGKIVSQSSLPDVCLSWVPKKYVAGGQTPDSSANRKVVEDALRVLSDRIKSIPRRH